MQCWNCGFENIPGLQGCARCGGTLSLDGVGVEPPRASRLRLATHLERTRHRLNSWLPSSDFLTRPLSFLVMEHVAWGPLIWSLILPGLGHINMRRRRLGWGALSLWLVFGLMTLLSVATLYSSGWLVAMICVHSFVLVSILGNNLAAEGLFIRLLFGLLMFLSLRFFLYWPFQQLGARFFMPLEVPFSVKDNLLLSGDRLLFEGPWLRHQKFSRGDLVAYRFNRSDYGHYVIRAGYGLDRIVGLPGDRVQVREGQLLINDKSPQPGEAPLGSLPPLGTLDIQLGVGQFAVFPTGLDLRFHYERNQTLPMFLVRSLTIIPEENIVGRAIFRIGPLSRFGVVQ